MHEINIKQRTAGARWMGRSVTIHCLSSSRWKLRKHACKCECCKTKLAESSSSKGQARDDFFHHRTKAAPSDIPVVSSYPRTFDFYLRRNLAPCLILHPYSTASKDLNAQEKALARDSRTCFIYLFVWKLTYDTYLATRRILSS